MIALWMIYATVVAAVLGGGAAALERAAGSRMTQRRWVWLVAIAAAVALPVWAAVSTPADARVVERAAGSTPPSAAERRLTPATDMTNHLAELIARADAGWLARLDTSLATAWMAAAGLALAAYAAATWSLARRRRSWQEAELDGQPVLLAPAVGPAVVGALRPRIVVPQWSLALPDEQRALMLAHEREHVLARDPLLLHVAAVVALAMPWNVAAWWLIRRLRLAVELDCDRRVIDAGRDPRDYGMLLLHVCSRRVHGTPLLAPALLERTSSLTRRILAMHPDRSRFPRTRVTLGAAAALALVVLACEMPSPEMIAPDGKNVAKTRVFGSVGATAGDGGSSNLRETVGRYFPAIARGEGGPAILFVVRSQDGNIVLTEAQPATGLVKPRRTADSANIEAREAAPLAVGGVRMLTRRPGGAATLPTGIGALRPDDIASVDVSKHAAGTLAPNAVSVITISLKPGVRVPTRITRAF